MCLWLKQYLSVADNARDAVFLHVSAASERQERRNETGSMTKKTYRHILTHSNVSDLLSCVFIQYSIWYSKVHKTLYKNKLQL